MGALYVYEPWPDAVDTLGLCGPLTPTKAVCVQERNGDFRLDIEHPIDEWGKWAKLVPGNLIKANVPLRTPPPFSTSTGDLLTSAQPAMVANVAASVRRFRWESVPVRWLGALPVGTPVLSLGSPATGYKRIIWAGGIGWIANDALTLGSLVTFPAPVTAATIEQYIPSPRARMQLFRVHSVDYDDKSARVMARQVYYDFLGERTTYAAKSVDAKTALAGIVNDWMVGGYMPRIAYTNLTGTKDVSGWKYASLVEAIMSPSNGMLSYWTGEILRDNWDIYLLDHAGLDRGYSIEYAKNLRGVRYSEDASDIISRILPIGQTHKGKPLYIPAGTYTVDGVVYDIISSVVSPHDGDYPVPHLHVMDKGSEIKAAGTTSAQLLAAYTKLIRAAAAKFADEQCDLPQITLSVDFTMLGDTAEYAQYRNLEKLFLYDTVRVRHPLLGIDVTTQVNKTVWNCLLDRYDGIELGSVKRNYARTRVAPWQVPGLASLGAYVDTISSLI